ncbi:MAG: hypothetical protein ABIQ47_06725 [Tepidiformaceae bacterium]
MAPIMIATRIRAAAATSGFARTKTTSFVPPASASVLGVTAVRRR